MLRSHFKPVCEPRTELTGGLQGQLGCPDGGVCDSVDLQGKRVPQEEVAAQIKPGRRKLRQLLLLRVWSGEPQEERKYIEPLQSSPMSPSEHLG